MAQLLVTGLFAFDATDRFVDAQAAAQGYAMSAYPLTTAAGYWNPAGVALAQQESVGFSYLNRFQLMNVMNVDYLYPDFRNHLFYGVNFLYQEIPDIDETIDIGGEGAVVGTFSDKQTIVNVSVAAEIYNDFYCGANVRGMMHQIADHSGAGLAADLGFIQSFQDNIFLGLTFKNTFSAIAWDTDLSESYDSVTVIGLAIDEVPGLQPLTLYLDLDSGTADNAIYFGGELDLLPETFFLRAGLNTLDETTFGFGLQQQEFIFDFAYVMNKTIENSMLFSFRYLLNNQKVRKYYEGGAFGTRKAKSTRRTKPPAYNW